MIDTVPCPPARGYFRILALFARWPTIVGAVSGVFSALVGPYVLLAAAVAAFVALYYALRMYDPIPVWVWTMGNAIVALTCVCSIVACVAAWGLFMHDGASGWGGLVMSNLIWAILLIGFGALTLVENRVSTWLSRS